ncbi:hypothetical protein CL656_05370 [bacterium]|nr:hypothetical protein [bacterium]|tara:strand:- start:4449 stop:6329 length:1881 start_codon:yes stop_codon:yes gene_type:complete
MKLCIITSNIKKKNIYESIIKSKIIIDYEVIIIKKLRDFLKFNDKSQIFSFKDKYILFISSEIEFIDVRDIFYEYNGCFDIDIFSPFLLVLNNPDISTYTYNKRNANVLDTILRYYFIEFYIKNENVLEKFNEISSQKDKKLSLQYKKYEYCNFPLLLDFINNKIDENYYTVNEYNDTKINNITNSPKKKIISISWPKNCIKPKFTYKYDEETVNVQVSNYSKCIIEYKSIFFGDINEFNKIINTSQNNNVLKSIGTIMMYNPKTQVINQIIDGNYGDINKLYAIIKKDYRHQIFWENINNYTDENYKEKCTGFEVYYMSNAPNKNVNITDKFNDKSLICKTSDKIIYTAKNLYEESFLIKKFEIKNNSKKLCSAYNEINILNSFKSNRNITKRPLHFETEKNVYLLYNNIYPYDLFDIISHYKHYGTNINMYYCLYIFKKMVNVSKYLYDNNILYCDFKTENICIDNQCEPILIDFDHSQYISNVKESPTGTLIYMAPELLQKKKNTIKSDIWALGCIFIESCFGYLPWDNCKNLHDMISKIESFSIIDLFKGYKNKNLEINKYSKENCASFFNNILCFDSDSRFDLEQIYDNKYFKNIISNNIIDKYCKDIKNIIDKKSINKAM